MGDETRCQIGAGRKGEQKEAQFARDNLRGASTVGSSYIIVPADTINLTMRQWLRRLSVADPYTLRLVALNWKERRQPLPEASCSGMGL